MYILPAGGDRKAKMYILPAGGGGEKRKIIKLYII